MEYKVESSLWNFPAWSGGKDTLETLIKNDDCNAVEELIDEVFCGDEVPSDTDINDFLWFERDAIAEHLGYEDWEAYEDGWSLEDLEQADDWFSEIDEASTLERISGYKREEYDDEDDFVYSVQEWWDGLSDKTKVEKYYKEDETSKSGIEL